MDTQHKIVGLMADPGLAESVARRVADSLGERLSDKAGEEWTVATIQESLPVGPDGSINLAQYASGLLEKYGWDYVFYLTDLPTFHDGQPILCRTVAQSQGALIVLPALGAIRLRSQVLELVTTLLPTLSGTADRIDLVNVAKDIRHKHMVTQLDSDSPVIVLRGPLSRARMLAGMVRGNQPFRLPGAMSGFLTAGAATGAFGIFYSSIWALADELHPGRLLLISAVVIGLLTSWLILRNGLWNKEPDTQSRLDNAATITTVGIGVLLSYVILFLGLLALSAVVVDADYLSSQLERPAQLLNYLDLSWLAASLGTLAGALGANFDSDEDVRKATYSRRWHERRKMFDTYNDSNDSDDSDES